MFGTLPEPPADLERSAVFLVGLCTVAACAMWLHTRHRFDASRAEDAWVVTVYGALPLAAATLWELGARLRTRGRVLALAGTATAVGLVVARLLAPAWASARDHDPLPLLIPSLVALGLLLAAARRARADLSRFGIGLGDWRWWLPRVALLAAILEVVVIAAAAASPEIRNFYPEDKAARSSAWELARYQASLGLHMLAWEGFFRGTLLFGLARRGDPLFAILAAAIPFYVLHWPTPEPVMLSSFVGAIAAGWLCLRARSFLPAFALHWWINLGTEATCFVWRQLG